MATNVIPAIAPTAGIHRAATAGASSTVTLRLQGGYGGQSIVPPGTTSVAADRGTTTLQINTTALAELGRAGADLNIPGIRIFKQKFAVDQVSMRAREPNALPIAPELGKLVFEVRSHDTMRRNQEPPYVADWSRAVGLEFWGYTYAEFAVVWERPQDKGGRVELCAFHSNAGLAGNLEFSLQEILVAGCAALGQPLPNSVATHLPLDPLKQAIAQARADGAIDASESSAIVAAAEAGGISPDKVRLVQDVFERTPTVSWSGPAAGKPAEPVIGHTGSTLLRAFLMRHHGLGGDTGVEAKLLRNHPLPRPPDDPIYPLSYVCGGSPDYNIPHQSPLQFTATRDQLWVHGGAHGLTISTPGGTIELPASAGGLRPGGIYEGGPRIVSGTRGGGGYVMNEGGRFKVHELEIDPDDGAVRRAVISWIAVTHGGFGVDLGLSPGHLVYDRPRLDKSVSENPTYKALEAALKDRGYYDATSIVKVLSAKGYIDDADRELLKVLRREYGVGLTARVDVTLQGFINSTGVLPLRPSGVHPTAELLTVLHNLGLPGRPIEYQDECRQLLLQNVDTLSAAVAAGYLLTDADRRALTDLSVNPLAAGIRSSLGPRLQKLGITVLGTDEHSPVAAAALTADPVEVRKWVQRGLDVNSVIQSTPLVLKLLGQCQALAKPLSQNDHAALEYLVMHPLLQLELTPGVAEALVRIACESSLATYADAIRRRALGQVPSPPGTQIWADNQGTKMFFDGEALYRNGIRLPTPPGVDLRKTRAAADGDVIAFVPADESLPIGSQEIGAAMLCGQGLVTFIVSQNQWGQDIYWRFNAGNGVVTAGARSLVVTDSQGKWTATRLRVGDTLRF